MLGSYRGNGGLARAEHVLSSLSRRGVADLSSMARWIVECRVISFDWQSEIWLPLFQFDPVDMSLRPEVAPLIAEWDGLLDARELAQWFARPNGWLGELSPAEVIAAHAGRFLRDDDFAELLNAARADRFAVAG